MERNKEYLIKSYIKSKQNNGNYDNNNSEDNNITFITNSKTKKKINTYLILQIH